MSCLKILARDCLSGDDETSEVCANAMSQLAFATFSTTVMLTYLVTYMKYIKELVYIKKTTYSRQFTEMLKISV